MRSQFHMVSTKLYCILHRNCSPLKFFLYEWLTFVLMLTIFHHAKAKRLCLASFLSKKKKTLTRLQASYFSQKKAHHTKFVVSGWWKIVSISTKASHTHRKNFRSLTHMTGIGWELRPRLHIEALGSLFKLAFYRLTSVPWNAVTWTCDWHDRF